MFAAAPIIKDLVLLGGGHAHVSVLKAFGMAPVEGLRVTLINRETSTPYSGMLPGLIASHYTFDETHIDLGRLARFSQARFIHDEATGIDPARNLLLFAQRPPLVYDVLSIDTGSSPDTGSVPGAAEFAVAVKPIATFLTRWEALCERALTSQATLHVAVAGAGAGGVEMVLAAQHRLQHIRQKAGISAPVQFDVFSAADSLLPAFGNSVQSAFAAILQQRGVSVHCGRRVARIEDKVLILENGERHSADEILFATNASAPRWFGNGGLAVDERGFVRVNDCLQSLSHPNVFAAGDIAAVENHPRPKAGVFAVRQGAPLTHNLRQAVMGADLRPYKPQKQFLSLISTGDTYALASRNGMAIQGKWVWRWKDWIDRKFMDTFNALPPMLPGQVRKPAARLPTAGIVSADPMRCGGCGAKVGADILSAALRQLKPVSHDDVIAGLSAPDDAAIVRPPQGKVMVHSVDSFRALIEDPYLFGKIAANHALSDIFAMGGEPHTALAIATLPYGAPGKTANDLHQLMAGAVDILNAAGAALVGGHTAEGAEMTLGFAVNGVIDEARALHKTGLRPGDRIILTKALGTGTLFAADMQYQARSRWIEGAVASMLQSNGAAAKDLFAAGARACTDITGFGLAGHLGEMAQASQVSIAIDPAAIPALDGANETIAKNIFSTLHEQNLRSTALLFSEPMQRLAPSQALLFDPQTSGGLAAGIAADKAQACVENLRALGYNHACIVAVVGEHKSGDTHLSLAS